MPLLNLLTKRELSRAWQVVNVIRTYDLIPLPLAGGLGRIFRVRLSRRLRERQLEDEPLPVRLRLALTELGTTFIKLGQVLSARSDLLPPEYLDELAKLQDEVPPLPYEVMEPVFRASFHYTPVEVFTAFDPRPIASASIGQVYRATMHDGAEVVVKIQRPGLDQEVNTDLALMRRVAQLAHRVSWLERFDLPSLVREFQFILQDELIYTLEAHNTETLAREMADRPGVRFQEVIWPFTSQKVLTTRWVAGVKITDTQALIEANIDRKQLAINLANSLLEQILLHGMFHGDPHPGNLLVTADGVIVFIDTGMVGRLDRRTRELLIELAISIFDQDIDSVLNHLQQLGFVRSVMDMPALRRDLSHLIMKYYFLPRRELRLGELLQRINNLLFEHQVRMAYEFGLMAKALFLAEGIAQKLDPYFDYNQAARPVIDEIRRRYYSLDTIYHDAVRELRGLRRQIIDLPRRLSTVLSHLEQGTARVRLTDDSIDAKEFTENVLVNRVSVAIVIIGIFLGSSFILSGNPTGTLRYIALGGLILDAIFMVILLVSIYRSGRTG